MSDYIVKDTELISVANAIRIKGGTNSQLVFPGGFVSAIGNISGGGGSSDFSTAQVIIVGQASIEGALVAVGTESAEFPDETTYGTTDYALQGLNSLTLILYKGSAFITVMGKGDIEVSGNIQPFAQTSNQFIVTGDCSITIS